MKVAIVLFAVVAVALSKPLDDSKVAHIVHEENYTDIDKYKFGYETSDGISRQEEAVLKNPGTDQEALHVNGRVSYIDKDGTPISYTYTADENGYHAEGDHIPKA